MPCGMAPASYYINFITYILTLFIAKMINEQYKSIMAGCQ